MSQLKKLVYNKRLIDGGEGKPIARWSISPWKVFFLFLAIAILMILVYGFFIIPQAEQQSYFGNLIFYAIVICITIAIIWILAQSAIKFRQMIAGFMIAFILILVLYYVLGLIFGYAHLMNFHMGAGTWILITFLSGLGAKRIDGDLDRKDIGYGLLVLLVLIGANIPISGTDGFLAMLDKIVFSNITNVLGQSLG